MFQMAHASTQPCGYSSDMITKSRVAATSATKNAIGTIRRHKESMHQLLTKAGFEATYRRCFKGSGTQRPATNAISIQSRFDLPLGGPEKMKNRKNIEDVIPRPIPTLRQSRKKKSARPVFGRSAKNAVITYPTVVDISSEKESQSVNVASFCRGLVRCRDPEYGLTAHHSKDSGPFLSADHERQQDTAPE